MSQANVVHMFHVPLIHYAIGDWRNAKRRIVESLPDLTEEMLNSTEKSIQISLMRGISIAYLHMVR